MSALDDAYAAATDAMGRAYFGGRWKSPKRLENASDRMAARAAVGAFLANLGVSPEELAGASLRTDGEANGGAA